MRSTLVAVSLFAMAAVGCGDSTGGGGVGAGAAGAGGQAPDGGGGGDVGGSGAGLPGTCEDELLALEVAIGAAMDAASEDPEIITEPNFTLLLEREDGRRLTHSHGDSSETTVYPSAST